MTPAPKAWWRAFGFAHDWREDGFVLAYDPEHGDAGEKAVVDLAVKYGQGAIYAYEPVAWQAGRGGEKNRVRGDEPDGGGGRGGGAVRYAGATVRQASAGGR